MPNKDAEVIVLDYQVEIKKTPDGPWYKTGVPTVLRKARNAVRGWQRIGVRAIAEPVPPKNRRP